jgi:hypothetical protein
MPNLIIRHAVVNRTGVSATFGYKGDGAILCDAGDLD